MSNALSALRLMPSEMQAHTLLLAVEEGSCSRETAVEDAVALGVLSSLLRGLRQLDDYALAALQAPYVDPHGKLWSSLSDAELHDRCSWCMRDIHHEALRTELARRRAYPVACSACGIHGTLTDQRLCSDSAACIDRLSASAAHDALDEDIPF